MSEAFARSSGCVVAVQGYWPHFSTFISPKRRSCLNPACYNGAGIVSIVIKDS